jgi:hypothetical protein
MEQVIVKTVAAFLNSQGGDLLIGIQDDGSIFGIEADQRLWKQDQRNRDTYENWLTTLLLESYGKQHTANLHISFARLNDNDVCRVTILPSATPVYVKEGNLETLFVRTGNSTRALTVKEAVAYHQQRFTNFCPLPVEPEKSQISKKYTDFRKVFEESTRHPKQNYFILKAIIVNNLFGVDIMEEAVEICKLRLFLKLVAQVESQDRIEPLPDIDFNIRAGNTLVGYARYEDVKKAVTSKLDFGDAMSRIEDKAKVLDSAVEIFCKQQTQLDGTVTAEDKAELRRRFSELEAELNDHLSGEYGLGKSGVKKWKESHRPFHWFCDFHRIIASGGFDVIIGNPPYVEFAKIRTEYTIKDYSTLDCGNLFAFVLERCKQIAGADGREGLIVPLSIVCTERMKSLRRLLGTSTTWTPSFDMRPSSLFEGVAQRLSIVLQHNNTAAPERISGGYRRWASAEREVLLNTNRFVKLSKKEIGEVIPKIVSPLEASILGKLGSRRLEWFVREDAAPVYVHRIVRYFIKALDKAPVFIDANGVAGRSDDYKPFSFDPTQRAYIVPLLNSSLFYWFWRSHSDGFHCGYGDVYRMPFKEALSPAASASLQGLGKALQRDLITNSAEKKIRTKAGQITYQEFYPKESKGILDDIDSVLAKHFCFTDDELDFIINYDIKYRLGADADDAEE